MKRTQYWVLGITVVFLGQTVGLFSSSDVWASGLTNIVSGETLPNSMMENTTSGEQPPTQTSQSANQGSVSPQNADGHQPLTPPSEQEWRDSSLRLVVPEGTVLPISLDQALNSKRNKKGDSVRATVTQSLYLGPYLAIPKGTKITGQITQINAKTDKLGRHPYIVVDFEQLKRASDTKSEPFSGKLIAYKVGLNGSESLGKLPQKGDGLGFSLRGIIGGAVSGAFINPIFGPIIGAGASIAQSVLTHEVARGGEVNLEAHQDVAIAVEHGFPVAVQEPVPTKPKETVMTSINANIMKSGSDEREAAFQKEFAPLLQNNNNALPDKLK